MSSDRSTLPSGADLFNLNLALAPFSPVMLPQEAGTGLDLSSCSPSLQVSHKSTSPTPRIVSAFGSYGFHVLFNTTEVCSGGLNFGSLFLILLAKQSNVLAHSICHGN